LAEALGLRPIECISPAANERKSVIYLNRELLAKSSAFLFVLNNEETAMKYALVIATVAALATPALADDVGVRAGPVGAGVTVGEGHDRDRDRDRTVIKEHEPADRTTVIKKDHDDGVRSKTIVKDKD
jgi:hypothetical protein